MKKITFYSELSYILGLIILAFGTAMMEAADFGLSMIVAPAYLLHLRLSGFLPWFTFGVAEYCLQAFLIVIMVIFLRRFRVSYLFSFVTAVIYGYLLDMAMAAIAILPGTEILAVRIVLYTAGIFFCAAGISLLFHTYLSPEAYELIVKELSAKLNIPIHIFKTGYDCASLAVAVIMSFCFFGFGVFEGVKFGTIICALINGTIINMFSKLFEKVFTFKDGLKFRAFFESGN